MCLGETPGVQSAVVPEDIADNCPGAKQLLVYNTSECAVIKAVPYNVVKVMLTLDNFTGCADVGMDDRHIVKTFNLTASMDTGGDGQGNGKMKRMMGLGTRRWTS